MARVVVDHSAYSKEEVVEKLKAELSKLHVVSEKTYMLGTDFVVRKSAFSGVFVSISVMPEKSKTVINLFKNAPNFLLRGPAAKIFGSNQLMNDVKQAISAVL